MPLSRRSVILGAGTTTLALIGGVSAWRVTRLPQTATLPWTLNPKPPADIRLDAFRHAILAPNPHNRQPWLIKLVGDDQVLISCDLEKRLAETDPFDRQITIGFGAFLEIARIAASQRGARMEITPFPEGQLGERLDARPVAHVRFVPTSGTAPDPLYGAITARRSNKDGYDPARIVPENLASTIAETDTSELDPTRVAAIRKVVLDAVTIEQRLPRTYMESVRLIRIGHDQVDAQPDGVDLAGPKMEALKLSGFLDHDQLADQSSTAFQTGLDLMTETYGSIPGLLWIKTPANSRVDQLEAGRRYVRANLRATALGIAMHPMSQSLQEFPEMAEPFKDMHRLLGASGGERVQMLARIGYGAKIGPAPRWPLAKHLI